MTTTHCTDNFFPLVAVTMQKATPSLDTIPLGHDPARRRTLCEEEKGWRQCVKLLELFSEGMVVNHETARTRKFPSAESEARGNPLASLLRWSQMGNR